MALQLRISSPSGEQETIRLCNCNDRLKNVTVEQLKKIIQCTLEIVDNVELVFGTEILAEENRLLSYGIRHMSHIQAIIRLKGGI